MIITEKQSDIAYGCEQSQWRFALDEPMLHESGGSFRVYASKGEYSVFDLPVHEAYDRIRRTVGLSVDLAFRSDQAQ